MPTAVCEFVADPGSNYRNSPSNQVNPVRRVRRV